MIRDTVREFNGLVWDEMDRQIVARVSDVAFRDIVAYVPRARRGGAANRPFSLRLGFCLAGGGQVDRILPLAAAVEIANSAITYTEDRIIDDDPSVGDCEALHRAYGVPRALLASAALRTISRSIVREQAQEVSAPYNWTMMGTFDSVFLDCDQGQYLDVALGEASNASQQDAEMINDLRTGQFIRRCAEIGVLYAQGGEQVLSAVSTAFHWYGRAVQDKNDYYDNHYAPGSPSSFGSDLRLFKKTKPIVWALEMADGPDRDALLRILGQPDAAQQDISRAMEAMERCGAIARARTDIWASIEQAVASLSSLPESLARKQAIEYIRLLGTFNH